MRQFCESSSKLLRAAVALSAMLTAAAAAGTAVPPSVHWSPRVTIGLTQTVAPGGIHEFKAIEIGGIRQWISIRGNDPQNPMLLFLHGGPGSPMMPESWTFQRPWEDFFTVVQWDQRGAGKTFSAARRRPDAHLTLEQIQADTEELIQWLRHTYGKEKIFLLGHSWGSILGVRVAQHRPDWLYAYIGVSQVVNGRRNEIVSYQETLAQAKAVRNPLAVGELLAIAPYPEPQGQTPLSKIVIERKWDAALGGMRYGRSTDEDSRIWALSPDYTTYDQTSAQLGELNSIQRLLSSVAAVNFDDTIHFKCPVFFFAGAEDRTTPESLVEEYFQRLDAPQKHFFKIKHAAHYVVNEAPGEVLVDLVNTVRPLAGERSDPK